MQSEAGIPDDKIKPCAGEGENGTRIQMLPASTKIDGASGTYRPMGAPGMSASSQVYPGAYAFKIAVDKLDGKDVPKLEAPVAGSGRERRRKAMRDGDLGRDESRLQHLLADHHHQPRLVSSVYNPDLPEVGLQAALVGQPEN